MARLRDLLRITTAVVLSFGLTAASISTASTPGFGTVVSAQYAHVGRAAASVGTTVFSGDSLDTEELGSLQVRAGAARLLLPASQPGDLGHRRRNGGGDSEKRHGDIFHGECEGICVARFDGDNPAER